MKRVWLILIILLAIPNVTLSQAQGNNDCDLEAIIEDSIASLESSETVEEAETVTSALMLALNSCDVADEDAGSTRSNPVPFGKSQLIRDETMSLKVIGYTDDATAEVVEANSFNEYESDERFVIFTVEISCQLSVNETCTFNTNMIGGVGSNGQVYNGNEQIISGFSFDEEIFGGSTVEMQLPIRVGSDETDILLIADNNHERVFFSSK